MSDSILSVTGLVKRFGGVAASAGVDLAVAAGELHAIIGPNGSGKTTLLSQIFGEVRPDAGAITFAGRNITGTPVHTRVLMGISRSYQITSNFPYATLRANLAFGLQSHARVAHRFWRRATLSDAMQAEADTILKQVGLSHRADTLVNDLAHGEHRQLELALALSTHPRLLLLDEPFAGLGAAEGKAMVRLIASLKGTHSIILVEHDIDAVFALADRITVLAEGRVLATGSGDDIRTSAAVRAAYLGEP